jgi:hypothetical protein
MVELEYVDGRRRKPDGQAPITLVIQGRLVETLA